MILEEYIDEQIKFSREAFGPGARTKGIIEHIRKELIEIEQAPEDLEEWIDIIILAIDGAWRAGYCSYEISSFLTMKLEKNRERKWPDWKEFGQDKAIEHERNKHEN